MTLTLTPITVALYPTPEQATQLISIAERLNTLRTWCYAQAVGHVRPGTTLAEMAYGAPAASTAVNDEVEALMQLSFLSDLPADVLVETITQACRAIREERQQTGGLRPYSEVWQPYDITITGTEWISVWTPEIVTLAGVDGAVRATHHTVPLHLMQGWRQARLAWCAWTQGSTAQPGGRTVARYRQDQHRYQAAGKTLPTVSDLVRAWEAVPANGGQSRTPAWARVEQLESGWWLTFGAIAP